MIRNKLLRCGDTNFTLTAKGRKLFAEVDIDCDELRNRKCKFAHQCLDWSKHKFPIAGALVAEIYSLLSTRKWLRMEPKGRAINLTVSGEKALHELLGMQFS